MKTAMPFRLLLEQHKKTILEKISGSMMGFAESKQGEKGEDGKHLS